MDLFQAIASQNLDRIAELLSQAMIDHTQLFVSASVSIIPSFKYSICADCKICFIITVSPPLAAMPASDRSSQANGNLETRLNSSDRYFSNTSM